MILIDRYFKKMKMGYICRRGDSDVERFIADLVETISGSRKSAPINRIDVSDKLMYSL